MSMFNKLLSNLSIVSEMFYYTHTHLQAALNKFCNLRNFMKIFNYEWRTWSVYSLSLSLSD